MDERPHTDGGSGSGPAAAAADEAAAKAVGGSPADALGSSSERDISASEKASIRAAAQASSAAGSQAGAGAGGKRFSAPDAPRWRFIDQAKKTEGYSSFAAGTVVKGKTAQELVGKYEPKWKDDAEEVQPKEPRHVGKLKVPSTSTVEETFEGSFAGFHKKGVDVDELTEGENLEVKEAMDDILSQVEERTRAVEWEEVKFGAKAAPVVAAEEGQAAEEPAVADGNEPPAEETEKLPEEDTKKKRKCLLLLLLLLIGAIIGVVLGVLLGGDKSDGEDSNKAIDGGGIGSEEVNATTPTAAPAANTLAIPLPPPRPGQCASDETLFALLSDSSNQQENTQHTWTVRDACTGEEVMRCRSCSEMNSSSLFGGTVAEVTTPAPTAPTTLSIDEVCIGETSRPRPGRDGERFRFNLHVNSFGSGACVDSRGRRYEWLKIGATDFGDCAERCVQDPPAILALSESFRGFDFNCAIKECRCLFDGGVLGGSDALDQVNSGDASAGVREVAGVVSLDDHYCGKRVQDDDVVTDAPTTNSPVSAPKLPVEGIVTFSGPNSFNGCLSNEKEYIFEVEPIGSGGASCCGFVPESFVATYDDIVVVRGYWPEGKEEEGGGANLFGGASGGGTVGPSLDELTTSFGASSEPCPAPLTPSAPSTPTSRPTNVPTTESPLPPFQDLLPPPPDGGIYPCREQIEAEMAGRINGLPCNFCGHCQWKASSFNCYQRVAFLWNTYQVGQLQARINLCNQGWCQVPAEGVGPGIQAAIERASYCYGDPPPTGAPIQSLRAATGTPTLLPSSRAPVTTAPIRTAGTLTLDASTSPPSKAPVTDEPTKAPATNAPVRSPTAKPTTVAPTSSPLEAPTTNEPATSSPSKRPTNEPSAGPTRSPVTPAPSLSPIVSPVAPPTSSPSTSPLSPPTSSPLTPNPTESPTDSPTCVDDSVYEDFNLCFAIDMSGSVCNQGTGFECEKCEPELICNEAGVDPDTCCTHFFDVTEFAKLIVNSLDPIPVEKSYSVVGYASGANVALSLGSLDDTLSALDELAYTGGRTNHADAINACASSLRSADVGRTNMILLITDGDPSEPQGSPQEAAEGAANAAKSDGVFITPVVITEENWTHPPDQQYLAGISSDGSVFNVDDFGLLDSLREGLIKLLSCQLVNEPCTLQDFSLPPGGGIYPCREVTEAEMTGRIRGLPCNFCGFCWHLRISFLHNTYGTDRFEARQNLCNQGWCQVPKGGLGPGLQAAIERAAYCGEPPPEGIGTLATCTQYRRPTRKPTSPPSKAPVNNATRT